MRQVTPQLTSTPTAVHIGRMVDANLSNWATGAMIELARADQAGIDTCPLLSIGLSILRARREVRAGIREIHVEEWRARR